MKKLVLSLILSLSLFGSDRFETSRDVVKDYETGLMWQKSSSVNSMNWQNAIEYCKNSSTGGYRDWRLPYIDELKSIVNYQGYSPATFKNFNLKTEYHWSITKDNSSKSWVVDFSNGSDDWYDHSYNDFAVCVRDFSTSSK